MLKGTPLGSKCVGDSESPGGELGPETGWSCAPASQGPKSGGFTSLRLHMGEDFLEPLNLSVAQFKPPGLEGEIVVPALEDCFKD